MFYQRRAKNYSQMNLNTRTSEADYEFSKQLSFPVHVIIVINMSLTERWTEHFFLSLRDRLGQKALLNLSI